MESLDAVKVTWRPQVPTAVPALVALAVVVMLSVAMFGWTSSLMRRTAHRSAQLVDIQLRSVELVDDMRYRVARLEIGSPEHAALRAGLLRDIQEYQPLLREAREVVAFVELRMLISRGLEVPFTAPERALWYKRIQSSMEQLVDINEHAARHTLDEIARTDETAFIGQLVAVIVVLIAASIVGSMLYRVFERQRERVQQDLQALADRNTDLASFVDRTAHDLRGPLTPIRGYAELLAAGSADVSKAATRIRSAAERIANILDDLTMLSTSGTVPAGEAEVGQAIRDVLADLTADLGSASTRVAADDCRVPCAPGVLYQLLHNIVSNACKYRSPARLLEVTIECECRGRQVAIAVSDNGIGMAPEATSRAFEPHFRASASEGIPGAGLGLSIVKRMVEALGGSCKVASELDRGTRVELLLPRLVSASEAPPPA